MQNRQRMVTDREADESLKALDALEVVPAEDVSSFSAILKDDVSAACAHDNGASNISVSELRLLRAIVEYPMGASSEYPKLARMSPNTFQKLRPVLIDKGFIREHRLESKSRGRASILLEPTSEAIALVREGTGGMDREGRHAR